MAPNPPSKKPANWTAIDEENYLVAKPFSSTPGDARWLIQSTTDTSARIVVNSDTVLRLARLMGLDLTDRALLDQKDALLAEALARNAAARKALGA